jgi:succinyl-CoA synthetase alpha subunit
MSILLDETTRVLVQGITGWTARRHLRYMLDYGTNVVGGVAPGRGGTHVEDVPVFDSVYQALGEIESADLAVLFVPAALARDAVLEAVDAKIETVVCLAEGVPFRDAMVMVRAARSSGVRLIGPNSQGVISPGRAKVGGTGGDRPSRMFQRGRVGVVSRSGGMGAETCWLLSEAGIGQSSYVAIGGELISGSGFADIALRFESDPETDIIVCFGEAGGTREEELADAISAGHVTKPVVVFIPGDFLESCPPGMSFGHAGAVVSGGAGAPSSKRRVLAQAGATVVDRWSGIAPTVREVIESLPRGGSEHE